LLSEAGRLASMAPRVGCIVALVAALGLLTSPSAAHEEKRVGKLVLTVGWVEEPAYAGLPNGVEVTVEQGDAPARDVELEAVVLFGDRTATTQTGSIPLHPVDGEPAEYRAFLIPTRPGTYTFEITGTVGKTRIDETITSGERTFEEVVNPAEVQFPEQDPTQGEIAERLERIDTRIASLQAALTSADDSEGRTLILSGAAVAVAFLALAVALFRRRERHAA
jgi:hypothetical protein